MIWISRLLLGAAIVAIWQALWAFEVVPRAVIGNPATVLSVVWGWISDGTLARNLPITLIEVALGLAIGILVGTAFAVVFAIIPSVARILNPLMGTLNAVPTVIIVPLFVLLLGFGITSKIAVSSLAVFFAVFFSVYQGLREIDRGLLNSARIQGASSGSLVRHVHLPAASLWVIGSLRLALTYAFLTTVVAEYLGSSVGLGNVIGRAAEFGQPVVILAGLLVVATVVLFFEALLAPLERRFTAWTL